MSDDLLDYDTELETDIGKSAWFSRHDGLENEWFKFSTDFEQIGISWNVCVRNNTRVTILSEPIISHTQKYSKLELQKVLTSAKFSEDGENVFTTVWIPTHSIIIGDE